MLFLFIYLFLRFCLFLDRGEGREKEKERNINVWLPLTHPKWGTWPATQACALTGNQTSNTLVHRPVLNPLSHTSQGCFDFLNIYLLIWERNSGLVFHLSLHSLVDSCLFPDRKWNLQPFGVRHGAPTRWATPGMIISLLLPFPSETLTANWNTSIPECS